jgi:hypothetical protein
MTFRGFANDFGESIDVAAVMDPDTLEIESLADLRRSGWAD